VVGLIRARTGDDRLGVAIPAAQIRQVLAGKQTQYCGPQGCLPGFLTPRQNQQDDRLDRIEGRVFPTLPPPGQDPGSRPMVVIDMDPVVEAVEGVGEQLGGMDSKLDQIIEQTAPAVPDPPAADPTDPAIAETQQQLGILAEVVKTAIGDQETLRERFEARLARVQEELGPDASLEDTIRGYAADYLEEKGPQIGWTFGEQLGASLGIPFVGIVLAMGGYLFARIGLGKFVTPHLAPDPPQPPVVVVPQTTPPPATAAPQPTPPPAPAPRPAEPQVQTTA
jgi:hypothetical protein